MRMLGLNPTDHEVQELVNDLDYDGENSRNIASSAVAKRVWKWAKSALHLKYFGFTSLLLF